MKNTECLEANTSYNINAGVSKTFKYKFSDHVLTQISVVTSSSIVNNCMVEVTGDILFDVTCLKKCSAKPIILTV